MNCGRRETSEEDDANGVGKVKGIFTLSCKKGNRQRAVASHPAVPGVDFRKQAFVLSVFFKIFTYLVHWSFLFVACCVRDPYVRIPSLAVKVVVWTVEHSADAWSCLCCENYFSVYNLPWSGRHCCYVIRCTTVCSWKVGEVNIVCTWNGVLFGFKLRYVSVDRLNKFDNMALL